MFSIPILSAEECARARNTVHALRSRWITRGSPEHPFHTVGAASYIDATSHAPAPRYSEILVETNPVLREHFRWLYARVMYALSIYLQAEVRTADDLALPGFHVWEGLNVPTSSLSIHFDLQYLAIPWPGVARADRTRPLSFTLPVALPKAGGGLNSWDLRYEAQATGRIATPDEMTRSRTRTFHPYAEGAMTLHSGHTLHQIAAVERAEPDDERITLQGHGLYCDGAWTIYW